jgi:hypothetical protein
VNKLTLAAVKRIVNAAIQSGMFADDYFYGYEPHVTAKLLEDREVLARAVESAIKRLHPGSPASIGLKLALDEANRGWPVEDQK